MLLIKATYLLTLVTSVFYQPMCVFALLHCGVACIHGLSLCFDFFDVRTCSIGLPSHRHSRGGGAVSQRIEYQTSFRLKNSYPKIWSLQITRSNTVISTCIE